MGLLARDFLLQKVELKKEKVMLTKTDYVFVRQMTGKEKEELERSMLRQTGKGVNIQVETDTVNYKAKLAVATVCDDNGVLIFKPSDVSTLNNNIDAATLELIVDVSQRLNKITQDDKEEQIKN